MKTTIHRAIANARERDRTESINNAFNKLRTLLPTEPAERKLSKVEILRLATSYIRHLANIKSAKSAGLSERNVCLKSSRDFCTFCITAKKDAEKIKKKVDDKAEDTLNDDKDDGEGEERRQESESLNLFHGSTGDSEVLTCSMDTQATILSYNGSFTTTDYPTDSMSLFVLPAENDYRSWSTEHSNAEHSNADGSNFGLLSG